MNSYAMALLEVAEAHHLVDEIAYQFDQLNESVFGNKKWLKMMDSPMISKKEKAERIDELGLNIHLASMLKLLAQSNRMELYDDIYPEWVRMMRSKNSVAHVNVYTVEPLNEKQTDALTKKLQARFRNLTIELHVKVRDHLIGGLQLVYQGKSLDNSIARELEELFMTL